MTLLHEIQAELLDPKSSIGPILLKLRYLADRLGSDILEEWVKYETEGYPEGVEVPAYRQAQAAYRGTFVNIVQQLTDVPIPNALIESIAGPDWTRFAIRDSIAVIDTIVAGDAKELQNYGVSAGNLILALRGKVYPDHEPISISGKFSGSPFSTVHHVVRAKILDLTLELEKKVPIAKDVEIGKALPSIPEGASGTTTQITQNIFYGNQTNITNQGPVGTQNITITAGDADSLKKWLVNKGVPVADAKELAEIAASEQPENDDQPFGKKAKAWMAEKLSKGGEVIWSMKKGIAEGLIVEGMTQFYGWMV